VRVDRRAWAIKFARFPTPRTWIFLRQIQNIEEIHLIFVVSNLLYTILCHHSMPALLEVLLLFFFRVFDDVYFPFDDQNLFLSQIDC